MESEIYVDRKSEIVFRLLQFIERVFCLFWFFLRFFPIRSSLFLASSLAQSQTYNTVAPSLQRHRNSNQPPQEYLQDASPLIKHRIWPKNIPTTRKTHVLLPSNRSLLSFLSDSSFCLPMINKSAVTLNLSERTWNPLWVVYHPSTYIALQGALAQQPAAVSLNKEEAA